VPKADLKVGTTKVIVFMLNAEEFAAYDPTLHELLSRVFNTHHIPMDVFHGRRIRAVTCPS
jgi:hypothetical protein